MQLCPRLSNSAFCQCLEGLYGHLTATLESTRSHPPLQLITACTHDQRTPSEAGNSTGCLKRCFKYLNVIKILAAIPAIQTYSYAVLPQVENVAKKRVGFSIADSIKLRSLV